MPTIRIDEEVYEWLQQQAKPFEDTPNSVMRRIATLDTSDVDQSGANRLGSRNRRGQSARGSQLAIRENLKVKKAYYHWEGIFFEPVHEFPVALFDEDGYVIFDSEYEYLNHPDVERGKKTNIRKGIASFSTYKKMSRPAY